MMFLEEMEAAKDVIVLDAELVITVPAYAVAFKDIMASGASIRLFSVKMRRSKD
jgi:hypothetical protein